MKLYNKLRNLKKSTKIGLAGSLAYIGLSCVTPVLADNKTESFDINTIGTVEQADQAYDKQINKSVEDGKISIKEIFRLYSILDKKMDFLTYQRKDFENKLSELSFPKDLYSKLEKARNSLENLDSKKIYEHPDLTNAKKEFNDKVLYYYPLLIGNPSFYSASDSIEQELTPVVKEMTKKVNAVIKKYYDDNRLELLKNKKEYAIKDLLILHKVINKKYKQVVFNSEEINQEKQNLATKIKALEIEKEQRIKKDGQRIDELGQRVESIRIKLHKSAEAYDHFETYLNRKNKSNNFIEDYGDLNKYISFSIISVYTHRGFLDDINLKHRRGGFKKHNQRAISNLEDYFKIKGFDVKVEALKNPAKTMLPWPWWINAIFGAVFPLFRNILTAELIKRDCDEFDIAEGFLEPIIFATFLDGVFPLMYPLRLFGMPFIVEPIRAATGWRET